MLFHDYEEHESNLQNMTIDKKRLNEIVPVSHPIFWFGTILAQKSNNKNYSNNTKTNQVELISSCYHDIIQTK